MRSSSRDISANQAHADAWREAAPPGYRREGDQPVGSSSRRLPALYAALSGPSAGCLLASM
jgi:hypothetical protein